MCSSFWKINKNVIIVSKYMTFWYTLPPFSQKSLLGTNRGRVLKGGDCWCRPIVPVLHWCALLYTVIFGDCVYSLISPTRSSCHIWKLCNLNPRLYAALCIYLKIHLLYYIISAMLLTECLTVLLLIWNLLWIMFLKNTLWSNEI